MQAPSLAILIAALLAGESLLPSGTELADRRTVVSLPATASYTYSLTGRIRPLLFWIGRDHVGMARITRRSGDGVRGYELLVGSDPASAPRHLNRWGYIAETASQAGGSVFALMTGGDEDSYASAAASAAATPGEFRAIRSRLSDGSLTWETARIPSQRALTVFDLDAAMAAVHAAPVSNRIDRRSVNADTRPGFLSAVAALLDASVAGDAQPRPVTYVFGPRTCELRVASRRQIQDTVGGERVRALRVDFDILTLQTGEHTEFEVTTALEGPAAGVPIRIAWQPKWWLGLELRLDAGAGGVGAAEGR